jgi:hypothetical protein
VMVRAPRHRGGKRASMAFRSIENGDGRGSEGRNGDG